MKSFFFSPLMSLLLLALFLAGTLLFILPTRAEVQSLEVSRLSLEQELTDLEAQLDGLKGLSTQVGQSEATQEALAKALPVGMAQDQLILDLAELAKSTGFVVNALNFSQGGGDLGPTVLLTANVSGTYDKLLDFLQKLEHADRLIRVLSMNVQRSSTTEVVFSIQMEALYQN